MCQSPRSRLVCSKLVPPAPPHLLAALQQLVQRALILRAAVLQDHDLVGPAEVSRAGDERVEHLLKIGGRQGDDAQHIVQRRPLL